MRKLYNCEDNKDLSCLMRKLDFCHAKTKAQMSFAVTAKLIRFFVFAILIVPSLFFINPIFHASSYLLWLHSLVYVGPSRKTRRPVFSCCSSFYQLQGHGSVEHFLCLFKNIGLVEFVFYFPHNSP